VYNCCLLTDVSSDRYGFDLGSGDYQRNAVRPPEPVSCGCGDGDLHHQGHKQQHQAALPFIIPIDDDHTTSYQEHLGNKGVNFASSSPRSLSRLEIQALTDGRALLTLNEYISQEEKHTENKENRQDGISSTSRETCHAPGLLQGYDIGRQHTMAGYGDVPRSPMELSFDQTRMQHLMPQPAQPKVLEVTL
jgi:hypothetical protein